MESGRKIVIGIYEKVYITSIIPAFEGDTMFVGSADNNIYAVSLKDRSVMWKASTSGAQWGIPIVHKGMVLSGGWDCRFYAFDIKNGSKLWNFQTSLATQAPLEPDIQKEEMPAFTVTWQPVSEEKEERYKKGRQQNFEFGGSLYGSHDSGYMGSSREYMGKKRGYR